MGTLTMKTAMILFWIGITLCTLSFVLFVTMLKQQRKMRHEMEMILQKLDDALSQKDLNPIYDETLNSAISERLDKIIKMMKRTKQQTKEEISSIRALISNISHQIKTPLANIMLYTDILKEDLTDKKDKGLIDKVIAHTEKLDFFMQKLVKCSYTEIEMLHLIPENSHVGELLKQVCQLAELAALKKHIIIECQHTEIFAMFDMKWTIEAIGNILDNAIKYSPMHSHIHVSAISYESFVCIQITDEGIGIREEEQGLVFQRFYRSEDVKGHKGMGIGLYLTREIIIREGGYIKIESSKDSGTTFRVFLPYY